MQNYHNHKSFSNINTSFKDSAMLYDNYAKRAVELGQDVLSSVEHGWQGNYLRCYQAAQKYSLKFVYGTEAYWVRNRHEDDRTNAHIIILAKTLEGIYQINEMLSDANETGYYFVPRVDPELMSHLDPNDVFITTACVAFWGKVDKDRVGVRWHYGGDENDPSEILRLFDELAGRFHDSMALEVQCHNTSWQKEINRLCIKLKKQYKIPLIVGLDSHYIYDYQKEERRWLREESGVRKFDEDYEFDEEVYEDYPDEQTVIDRLRAQGILNEDEIREAIDMTDTICLFDDIEFDTSRKLPTIYPDLTQEERNQKYLDLVWGAWERDKEKYLASGIPESEYVAAIKKETEVITSTGVADYFILDHEMVRLGKEKGGFITPTGRGSSASFFTNTLLGLSTIDRLSLPVQLYPERFVTADRLKTSLPDLDCNLSDQEPFTKAQEELLGVGHIYPMIAYGTLKIKSAFKLYARAQGVPADIANEVTKQIDEYDRVIKEIDDEEERDLIDIADYVSDEYVKYITASESYRGIVVSKSQAPCAFMVYGGNIRREVGIMRINANQGKKIVYCTVIDGYTADEFGYVKNDELLVRVITQNAETMRRAQLPQYTSQQIIELTKNDQATWDILAKGYTQGINQCQGVGTTEKLMTYKPRSLQDMSAFVAAIRPGFKSMASKFLHREKFQYGIPSFDALLKNDSSGSSWMLYQEDIMKCLSVAGFAMAETYPIIKAISKKKVKVIEAAKERFLEGFSKYILSSENMTVEDALDVSRQVWQIIIDSSKYSFNACLSGKERLFRNGNACGRYEPTIEEMWRIKNDKEYANNTGHHNLHAKYKAYGYGISVSMYDDMRVRTNRIVDIRPAGIQQTFRITLTSGAKIDCTANHKFPTPNGTKRCDELLPGDTLYVKGDYEKCKNRYTFTDGIFDSNVPHKGQMGFQKNPDGASVKYLSFRDACVEARLPCNSCGKQYSDDERFEVHHRDMNRYNNEWNNFDWLCVSCHKKAHYQNGRKKRGEKGYPVLEMAIVSIEQLGEEMTYDIEMADPAHNFANYDGIISCNSHAVAVALDAMYGAYLKAHYPYEYYSTLLDDYSAAGNKDKVALIKTEMKRAFGISVVPARFRQDNRTFFIDKEHHHMSDALSSIKYISKTIASELYKMRDEQFDTFVDLLVELDANRAFNSRSVTILIRMGYFEEFGSTGKLLAIYNEVLNGSNKWDKQRVEKTKIARLAALKEFETNQPESEVSVDEQLDFECEYLGSPISVFPSEKKRYIVLDANTTYSPKLKVYSISTGRTGTVKIYKKDFKKLPVEKGDIITVISHDKKPAYTFSGGERRIRPGVEDVWLTKYKIDSRKGVVIT